MVGVVAFRLLGPVEAWAGPARVELGPRLCAVLAALAVDAGRLVPADVLVDRVWGEDAPDRARRTLHTHITRVRRVAEQVSAAGDGPAAVLRRTGGYLLDVDPGAVDLHRFRRLVEQARAPAAGERQRLELLREAVDLWRGEPLTGVAGEWAARLRPSWRQEQVAAVVSWADAELRTGDPAAVPAPVAALLEEFPLVEPLAAALMRAFAAAGRTAEALDVYTALRERLADELGADPGAELQAVHQAVLRGELPPAGSGAPAGPAPVAGAGAAMAPAVVPAQLPADVPGFTGRGAELARLDALLAEAEGQPSTAVVISAVSGTAGVGKTALAVHWAHRVAHRFPDGQLYVNLRGFDPGGQVLDPGTAVRGFLEALGVPAQRMPADLHAQAALYRSLLAGRQVLVVLDNARDAEHVRPLLPGTATAFAVVTSRSQLTPLVATDGAHPLALDLLTRPEAHELLEHRLGWVRVAAEPAAVERIIAECAALPLALSIAAARASQTAFGLGQVAEELADVAGRLDALDAGDPLTQVRAVFSWSYATLSPAAARLFRLLGLHPGPDVTAPAAAALAARPQPEVRRLLAELTRASLLTEHTPGRYGCHDLLRTYAIAVTADVDPDGERRAAVARLLDHYTHTAHAAARALNPTRDPIPLPLAEPVPGVTPEPIAGQPEATGWLTAEHPALLAAARLADEQGFDRHTWQLAWSLSPFFNRQGHWQDWAVTSRLALRAGGRMADPTAQAYAHRELAFAHVRLDRIEDALAELHVALNLYDQSGNLVGQAHSRHTIAALLVDADDTAALDQAQRALALFGAAGHRHGQADILPMIARLHAAAGDDTRALAYAEQALALHQELADRYGEATSWQGLGYVHRRLEHTATAVDCYRRALALFQEAGDRYQQADTLLSIGDTHADAGDQDAARAAWRQALGIFTDLGHANAAIVGSRLERLDDSPSAALGG
jgi:DNA-binding SARP family transcriptional activator/tetratricopeptide (TPR) repeat protein